MKKKEKPNLAKDIAQLGGVGLGAGVMQHGISRLGGGNMLGGVGKMMPMMTHMTMLHHTVRLVDKPIKVLKKLKLE